ncbi:MAG: hypothetical protein RL685_4009 [Pseudomonadota bacterium]|jgi:hypothetical protein
MSDEGSGELLKVKGEVSASGGAFELELGSGLPAAFAMLFPGWAAKRQAKLVATGQILQKMRAELNLDDAEVHYASQVFGEAESKLIRRKQIQARALIAFQEDAKQLPAANSDTKGEPAAEPSAKGTSEDWVSKFWEDAGVVSDEVLQEVYARVLASEARAPGSCSLRTLSALRYLDREAAEDFAKVAALIVDGRWLPEAMELLPRFGVHYSTLMNVVESRLLVAPGSNIIQKILNDQTYFRCGSRLLGVSKASGASFQILPLTTAGRELYRIANYERQVDYFFNFAVWLRSQHSAAQLDWAEMPSSAWEGRAESLKWSAI